MKKFKKEIISIVLGSAIAYAFQLFGLFICFITNSTGSNIITKNMFIPSSTIFIVTVPIISWLLMGLLEVSWIKAWIFISICIYAFTIPFIIISGITLFVAPHFWQEPMYWVVNVLVSVLLSLKLLKSTFIFIKN